MATETMPLGVMSTTLICNQLRRDEGFRQFPYRDGRGVLTVGYGFNLESDGLSQTEAGTVLHLRVYTRYRELVAALPWVLKLDLVRQAVLVNMAYNMGVHGLLEFAVTLTNVQAGDYEAAADAMLKSTWADQVGARAQRLAVQMRTGEWQ